MPPKVFVDTSGFFAYLNTTDPNHNEARKRLVGTMAVTSNYIFDELMTLLTARGKKALSISFGEELRGGNMVSYHCLSIKEEGQAWDLYKKYRDQPLSFTDCTTLTLIREQRIRDLLSFDRVLIQLAASI